MKTKILEHVRNVCGLKEQVQWCDLFCAIAVTTRNGNNIHIDMYGNIYFLPGLLSDYYFDLSKTVEQNLEDPELCKLLVEVLNIK